jgi:hypothetical protein
MSFKRVQIKLYSTQANMCQMQAKLCLVQAQFCQLSHTWRNTGKGLAGVKILIKLFKFSGEKLYLVKHREVGGIHVVFSKDSPRTDNFERRFPLFHFSDLHSRGVSSQQERGQVSKTSSVNVESILHISRRMRRGKAKCLEVKEVILDLGT